MGAGRTQKSDPINLAVGVVLKGKVGTAFHGGQPVATIYADSEQDFQAAKERLSEAIMYSDSPVPVPSVIKAKFG